MTHWAVLDEHTAIAHEALGPGAQVSIGIWVDGEVARSASTDDAARRCAAAESEHREGPGVLAATDLHGVLVPDVDVDGRWDTWRAEMRSAGFRSAAAIPAHAGRSGAVVVVSMYSASVDPWDAGALVVADGVAHELAGRLGRSEAGAAWSAVLRPGGGGRG